MKLLAALKSSTGEILSGFVVVCGAEMLHPRRVLVVSFCLDPPFFFAYCVLYSVNYQTGFLNAYVMNR
jgi:hypothetical protein